MKQTLATRVEARFPDPEGSGGYYYVRRRTKLGEDRYKGRAAFEGADIEKLPQELPKLAESMGVYLTPDGKVVYPDLLVTNTLIRKWDGTPLESAVRFYEADSKVSSLEYLKRWAHKGLVPYARRDACITTTLASMGLAFAHWRAGPPSTIGA